MTWIMKTLLVYYSIKDDVRTLCEKSRREGEIDVIELREKYDRGVLSACTVGAIAAAAGEGSMIDEIDVDIDAYDTVIIATPAWAFSPAPAVNAFLHCVNLSGKEVIGMIFGTAAGAHAADILRKRIQLAGGHCSSVVNVNAKQLKKRESDVISYAQQRDLLPTMA
ncbi:MAG TPA: NAD(P)H-dependent oxidoreductase [Candidatus Onthovicinus excrementipullorum]|nr:NAD(P)H-dependent oxidoreductase [Candidatus Onthovicinus excrementipullorum]